MGVHERVDATRHGSLVVRALIATSLLFGTVTTPSDAEAQARADPPKVGILSFGPEPAGTDPDPDIGVRQVCASSGTSRGGTLSSSDATRMACPIGWLRKLPNWFG